MAYKQFYLVPMVADTDGDRRFKYMRTQTTLFGYGAVNGGPYVGYDYGRRNQGIMCVNAEQIVHDDLASKPDIFQFPVDLGLDVTASELQPLRDELNSRGYPSLWVTSPGPYQGVVRNITKACLVVQGVRRFQSDLFGDDLTLRGLDLDLAKQSQLQGLATLYGISININNSLEVIMRELMEAVPTIDPRSKVHLSCYRVDL